MKNIVVRDHCHYTGEYREYSEYSEYTEGIKYLKKLPYFFSMDQIMIIILSKKS